MHSSNANKDGTTTTAADATKASTIPGACPTPVELGNSGWNILHSSAAIYPYHPTRKQQAIMRGYLEGWSHFYACRWCAHHLRGWMAEHPPQVSDKLAVTRYVCEMHNAVNEHTGKEQYDCDPMNVLKRWHPGFPDKMADRPSPEEEIKQLMKEREGGSGGRSWNPFASHNSASSSGNGDSANKAPPAPNNNAGPKTSDGSSPRSWREGSPATQSKTGKVADNETDIEAVLKRLKTCQVYCPENEQ